MRKEHLVLITSTFPYGVGESFLEDEFEYICMFSKVTIVPLSGIAGQCRVKIPENISIYDVGQKPWERYVAYLLGGMSGRFWQEIIELVKQKKFSWYKFKQILSFVGYGELYFYKIARKLKKEETYLFYSYWMLIHAYICIRLSDKFMGKAISRCHGGDLYEERSKESFLPLRHYLYSNLAEIYCISNHGKKYLLEKHYSNREKLKVSYLGTKDYGITHMEKKTCFKIVSCSWATSVKRIHLIIEALAIITEIDIKWIHYGGGDLLLQLKQYAERILPANIKFELYGAISKAELMQLYQKEEYHVFINVSDSEGIPVSIMEANSFGIPVIATLVGGTGEIVEDARNGFLLNKEFQNHELKALILKMYNMDSGMYKRMRYEARNKWEKCFNAEINYRDFFNGL